jgi:hypothetical protein
MKALLYLPFGQEKEFSGPEMLMSFLEEYNKKHSGLEISLTLIFESPAYGTHLLRREIKKVCARNLLEVFPIIHALCARTEYLYEQFEIRQQSACT